MFCANVVSVGNFACLIFSLFQLLDLLLFRFIMQQASIGLLPCQLPFVWLPPADLPPNIGQQKEIVKRLLGPKMMKKTGWDTDCALYMDLIAPRWRHCGEVFCGWGIVFAHCVRLGLSAFYYDLDIGGPCHNILTGSGLLFLIQNLLTIMCGGCVWFGIPCSTWVWIARGHTQRTKANINGNTHRQDVCQSNRMVDIIAMLLDLLVLRGVFYVIEQPSTSLVWFHKKLRNHFRSKPKVQNAVLKKTSCMAWILWSSRLQIHNAGWNLSSFDNHLQSQAEISPWRQDCLETNRCEERAKERSIACIWHERPQSHWSLPAQIWPCCG